VGQVENRAAGTEFREDFADRILPFDSNAARAYADVVCERRRLGRPIAQFDAQIAAIVRVADERGFQTSRSIIPVKYVTVAGANRISSEVRLCP
jgi:hypothetical protein